MVIKKLDRYMIRSFIGPFFAILFLVVFILMMQFLWLYIDELVGKGLSFKIILEFLAWGATTMLPLSMPLATVLSSVMTMGNMSENSELVAMKAAGISLVRIMAPLIVCAFFISVAAFFASNNLVPLAYNKLFVMREDITKTKDEIKIPSKTFYDGIDGYILRVENNDKKTGMMHGVMVYNHTSGKGNVSIAMADSAILKMSDDKSFLKFTMYSGINYEEDNQFKFRDTTLQLQRTEFARQEILIPLEHYEYQRSKDGKYSDQAKCMSLGDLIEDQDSIGVKLLALRKRQIMELRSDPSLRFAYQADSSRCNPTNRALFPLDTIKTMSLEQEIRMRESAASSMNSFISEITGFYRDSYAPAETLKKIDIEIYKKFSLALVCFLLFFIGAPLGAVIRKGGLGTPAIISVLFFVLYYIIDMVSTKLARDGAIEPFSGAFIASYIMLPIGVFLTYKAIMDEPVLGTDKIKYAFVKTKNFIMQFFHKSTIVFMGTPDFAVASLKALVENKYKVAAVVTVPDKPSGRGLQMNESAVKKYAVEHNIPVLQPVKLKDPEFIAQLQKIKPDIIAVVAFRMLPREVWSLASVGCFNLHAALLPQYRGAAPINWAIINGEKRSGVTSFLIDDGIDTGTIMIREQVNIEPDETAAELHDALMEIGSKMIIQTVDGLMEGNIDKRVQKSFIQGEEVLHAAPKLSRELCHIDWNDSCRHIHNLVSGLSDYPCAFTDLVFPDGKSLGLKIYRSEITSFLTDTCAPGTIVTDGKKYFGIAANDGVILLKDVQLAGKKRMGIEDFLRGMRDLDQCTVSKGTSREVISKVHAGTK